MTHYANRSSADRARYAWRRPTAIVLSLLIASALVLLVIDHRMHLIGFVPCLLLLAFPAIALVVYAFENRQARRQLEALERERTHGPPSHAA